VWGGFDFWGVDLARVWGDSLEKPSLGRRVLILIIVSSNPSPIFKNGSENCTPKSACGRRSRRRRGITGGE
jgi:hypothetical protein